MLPQSTNIYVPSIRSCNDTSDLPLHPDLMVLIETLLFSSTSHLGQDWQTLSVRKKPSEIRRRGNDSDKWRNFKLL